MTDTLKSAWELKQGQIVFDGGKRVLIAVVHGFDGSQGRLLRFTVYHLDSPVWPSWDTLRVPYDRVFILDDKYTVEWVPRG